MADVTLLPGGARGPIGPVSTTPGPQGPQGSTLATYTFATLPAPTAGLSAIVTDVGVGGSLWQANGSLWLPVSEITIAEINVAQNYTGSLTGHNFLVANLPANLLGTNTLSVRLIGTVTGSVNSKEIKVSFGLQSGGVFAPEMDITTTTITDTTFQADCLIIPRSTGSQLGRSWPLGNPGGWNYSYTNANGNIDTTQPTSVIIKGTLGSSADTITLEAAKIKLVP